MYPQVTHDNITKYTPHILIMGNNQVITLFKSLDEFKSVFTVQCTYHQNNT